MTEVEYLTWADAYGRTFGLNPEAATALAAWGDWLAAEFGATPARLAGVTRHVMARQPWPKPHDAAGHMDAIRDGLRAVRQAERESAAARQAADPAPACPDCDGTGLVIVPHPLDARGGVWEPRGEHLTGRARYRTAGLPCRCRAHLPSAAKVQPMSLAEYEARVNPRWREQLAERDELERKRLRDIGAATDLSRLGPNLRAMAGRVFTPVGKEGPS